MAVAFVRANVDMKSVGDAHHSVTARSAPPTKTLSDHRSEAFTAPALPYWWAPSACDWTSWREAAARFGARERPDVRRGGSTDRAAYAPPTARSSDAAPKTCRHAVRLPQPEFRYGSGPGRAAAPPCRPGSRSHDNSYASA